MSALLPVRRIVTANRPDGRSYIAEDGPARAVKTVPQRPGYSATNIWVTKDSPATVDAADEIAGHAGVMPPPNGTVLRVIQFPSEATDPAERKRQIDAAFAAMYPDAQHRPAAGQHPGMHKTSTIDYAIVLSGEIYAIMDEGETLMKAGDILIQRGTNHAWSNRSGKPCSVAFVLIDGR